MTPNNSGLVLSAAAAFKAGICVGVGIGTSVGDGDGDGDGDGEGAAVCVGLREGVGSR